MIFSICNENDQLLYQRDIVRLQRTNIHADDFGSSFDAVYYDISGRKYHLGSVRIGMQGMEPVDIQQYLPKEFTQLPEKFVSLGQEESYYENIKDLGDSLRESMLGKLRDLAFSLQWPDKGSRMIRAMLCGVDPDEKRALEKVCGQFHRMAQGKARLTEYHFTYKAREPEDRRIPRVSLRFDVAPASKPPTNIHALIGRNGCGKTYLIKHMVQCLQAKEDTHGEFVFFDENENPIPMSFANVVCIAFSPFDNFAELRNDNAALPSTFIGLDKEKGNLLQTIQEDFLTHFRNCLVTPKRRSLWKRAIETLKSDPTFQREEIDLLMDDIAPGGDQKLSSEQEEAITKKFSQLSSGHKVVLLIVTGCVAEVEERTIVFLDEPENHLHPPLLSALIRALSDLLMDRNGVAIVSTHSPVVLQEIPKRCVYLLTRYGEEFVKPERLERETFGSSLGNLIDDAFAFELDNSGFHKMMVEAAKHSDDYNQILEEYGRQLGDEARILLRMLIQMHKKGCK